MAKAKGLGPVLESVFRDFEVSAGVVVLEFELLELGIVAVFRRQLKLRKRRQSATGNLPQEDRHYNKRT